MTKSSRIFAALCGVAFTFVAWSTFSSGNGAVFDSTASFAIDLGLYVALAGLFSASAYLGVVEHRRGSAVFMAACTLGAVYSIVRSVESVIRAHQSGLDTQVATPIAIATGVFFLAVFGWFFVSELKDIRKR